MLKRRKQWWMPLQKVINCLHWCKKSFRVQFLEFHFLGATGRFEWGDLRRNLGEAGQRSPVHRWRRWRVAMGWGIPYISACGFFAAYCMASFKTQPKRPRSPLFWPRGFFGGGNMMTVQRPRGHPTNIYIYICVCVCPHLLRMVSRCFTRNFRQPPARDLVWLAVELARVLQGCMHSDKSMRHRTISVQFRHLGI
jgi:hypothetical protein